jgi:hypothetical protein
MSTLSKMLAGTVIGAGLIAGYGYVKNLTRAKAALIITPSASLHQLSWEGITIRVDVVLKNPTKGSFSFKFPFVKISHQQTLLGSSQAVNKDIKIPPYGEAVIEKILVHIPVGSVFTIVYTLIKSLFNKQAITVTVTTITTIDVGLAQIPMENNTNVVIKK